MVGNLIVTQQFPKAVAAESAISDRELSLSVSCNMAGMSRRRRVLYTNMLISMA